MRPFVFAPRRKCSRGDRNWAGDGDWVLVSAWARIREWEWYLDCVSETDPRDDKGHMPSGASNERGAQHLFQLPEAEIVHRLISVK